MSRTKIGRRKNSFDYFPTPHWMIDRLLEEVSLPDGQWIEPCVGDGAIIRSVRKYRTDVEWTAVDLADRPGQLEQVKASMELVPPDPGRIWLGSNFLSLPEVLLRPRGRVGRPFDVAITNPPFSIAEPIINRARELADVVVMLLRLNWFGSQSRAARHRSFPPDTFVVPDRPSFDGRGTDSIEYAWFVWDQRPDAPKHYLPSGARAGLIRVLDTTPRGVRNAARKAVPQSVTAEAMALRASRGNGERR